MAPEPLEIKQNVVKRLTKELSVYKLEAEQQKARIDKMVSNGADSYDIKKQYEVLDECLAMIPDTEKRLKNAEKDLEQFMGVGVQ